LTPAAALPSIVLPADRALQAGCDDYDTKPVDWPRLLAKIVKLLSGTARG
jgi:DNA-binding response OmpR family regulator